jgi:4-diphosphocytidyl-2-C-methyl-D-erythritol kinase
VTDPLRRLSPVVRLAPAKVNLTLAVTGRRPDAYHDLHSVMVTTGLSDRLSAAVSSGATDTLHVRGDAGPLADNLVWRAISEARRAVGRNWSGGSSAGAAGPPALAIRLEKAIPRAAGLAGGSSDAAAAVDAALEAWGAELDEDRRRAVALALGSDVPFFLDGGPALVEGRGERVTALPSLQGAAPGLLLVTPAIAVATAAVFAAFAVGVRSADAGSTRATSRHLADEWRSGLDAARLFQRAGVLAPANDLLAATAAVAPEARTARRALARLLARPVGHSGSGPTCWVLYPSLADAVAAAARVNEALATAMLRLPGDRPPFVHATTIVRREVEPVDNPEAARLPPGGMIALDARTPDH